MSDMVKTKTALGKTGGIRAAYKRITELQVNKATADTWHDFVYRQMSDIDDNFNETPIIGEAGETQDIIPGNIVRTLKVKANQLDAAFIKFLKNGGDGEYFMMMFDWGKGANSKKLEVLIPFCKVAKGGKFARPTSGTEITIYILDNTALASGPQDVPSWAVGTASDYPIAASEGYYPYEITPA